VDHAWAERAQRNNTVRLGTRKLSFSQSKEWEKAVTEHSSALASIKINSDLNLTFNHELVDHTQDILNLIARRAFEIFQSRGDVHGNDQQDWFLAESQLLTPVRFHISDSGAQLTARAEIPEFNNEDIKVSLEPRRLSISGMAEPHTVHHTGRHDHLLRYPRLMFRVINLPCEVDPSKSQATFNDGRLEVVMPKAPPAKRIHGETRTGLSAEGDSSVHEMGGTAAASTAKVGRLGQ
jgi:HSP20 family molecular chaperone IbpA